MSFYSDASLVLIPSGYKDQKVYSAVPTDGSGDLVFSRASSATRVASNGLIEKVRTNLILQSNQFDTTWTQPNTTVTSGQADPDGGTNAWLVTETTDGGSLRQSVTASGSLTFSMTLKANTGTTSATLFCTDASQNAAFDLSAGTFSESGATAKMVSLGNGWWRCSISFTASGASTLILFPSSGVVVGSTFAYEAQLETGDVATDYIATTSAAVSVGPVSGLPRLDYLNSTCPRLLLEPQRTNALTYSEQIENAVYTKTNTTITANATTSPDGYTNADALLESAVTSTHQLWQRPSITSGQVYTFSAFVKTNGRRRVQLQSFDNASIYAAAIYDVVSGTVVATNATASIQNYGSGWYRLILTATSPSTATGYAVLNLATDSFSSATSQDSYAGDTSKGVYVYGYQMEAGAYATSYIPTLGTSVTRVADAASKTGISSLIGQTEGVLYLEIKLRNLRMSDSYIFIRNAGTTEYIGLRVYSNGYRLEAYAAGAVQASVNFVSDSQENLKIAMAYKLNDFAFYVNGALIGVDTSGIVPTCSVLDLSLGGSTNSYTINQALLFKTRLTNAQLAELTA
jgi:hypothetical protein